MVGFCVISKPLYQLLLLIHGWSQPQLPGYFPRYFFLKTQDVREPTAVLLAPELRAVAHVYEVGLNVQGAIAFGDPAGKHRANVKITPRLLRVNLRPLIAKRY